MYLIRGGHRNLKEVNLEGKELLQQLSEAVGVSGRERPVREKIIAEVRPLVDGLRVDAMGNVIAVKHGEAHKRGEEAPGRLLMTAHSDEIGLLVSGFWNGFLRIRGVGGLDRKAIFGQKVIVHGREDLSGVIGLRPPHVDQGDKVPPWENILVDVGIDSEAEARQMVRVGDIVTFPAPFWELLNERVAGKAFDDRACVVAIIEALRLLQGYKHEWDIVFLAAVQEEVGHKGAITGGYTVFPDLAIALDVGFAKQPGVKSEHAFPAGKGPVLAVGPQFHTPLTSALKDVADRWSIPYLQEVVTGRSGTDAWALQVIRSGIPTALISLSLLSMHTVVETLQWQDVQAAARWLALFAASLTSDSRREMAMTLPEEEEDE